MKWKKIYNANPMLHRIIDDVKESNAVFVMGPKCCGKTICLKQMEKEIPEAKYIDFKKLSAEESKAIQAQVLRSIEEYEPVLYLLDHIAYADKRFLYSIYKTLSWSRVKVGNHTDIFEQGTHIVLCGSTSAIMEHWYTFAFGGFHCTKLYVDFPYDERIKTSWIHSIEDYLKGYLEEIRMAMLKSGDVPEEIVPKCDLLDEHVLMDILSCDTKRLQKWNEEVIRQGLLFLYRCKLIAFAEIREKDACVKNIAADLQWHHGWFRFREDLNKTYIYRVIHPWLYLESDCKPEMLLHARFKQKLPNYSDEKVWKEVVEYCFRHGSKFELYLNVREVKRKQECWKSGIWDITRFTKERKELMRLVSNFSRYELQKWFCSLTNFETVLIMFIADDYIRDFMLQNLPYRLKCLFRGELFTIIKHLEMEEAFLLSVINKAIYDSYSDDMQKLREEERWEREKFYVDQTLSLTEKRYYLSKRQMEIDAIAIWSKFFEPQVLKMKYLITEFEVDVYYKINNSLREKEYRLALEVAYQYSKAGKGRVSYILSGLEIDDNNQLIFSSYIIQQTAEKKVIYHYKNPIGSYPKVWIEEMKISEFQEVTEDRFLRFCEFVFEQKY